MEQRLILPFRQTIVSAGYLNANYKKQFGFVHYGMDMGCKEAGYDIHALGIGEVVACGQDGATLTGSASRLGNVIVVVYRDVLCNDGTVCDLACRMYHLDRILCKAGDRVQTGDVIGHYGNTGANTTGAHLHIEFDKDIAYPCYAYGVSAGGRIILRGTINSTVHPAKVWYLGEGQSIAGSSTSDCYVAADLAVPELPQEGTDYKALYEALMGEIKALLGKYTI